MHNRWVKFSLFAAVWLLLGWLLSLEVYFNIRAEMPGYHTDFGDLAIPQFGRAIMWGLVAPWVLRLRAKVPLPRGHWAGGIAFHLGMSLLLMIVFYLGRLVGYGVFFLGFEHFGTRIFAAFYGRNLIDIAYYWAVIGFGYGLEMYERYKSEELKAVQLETRLVETELKALREQLHPHFLFNTLNTIAVLVREERNEAAVTLIARLSSLLRMTLDMARTQEITLRQEMDFLERYVDIQKARFCDRLTVTTEIAPTALDARIPNLLLQPLVENAILHGVAPKAGPGHVSIRGEVTAGRLRLTVSDDGPGIDEVGTAREGVGLSNTRERLAKIYGSASQLSLRSERGRGLTVDVILPFRT